MRGETLLWMQLASHLRMPKQRCQRETTSSEFEMWKVYLLEQHDRQDYYLAQIAAEIRRTAVKKPGRIKVQQFLIKFMARKAEGTLSGEEKAAWSKAIWLSAVGVNPNKPTATAKKAPPLPAKVRRATKAYEERQNG